MYRPKGWKNIYENHIHVAGNKELSEVIMENKQMAFEAGADAMLDGLIKDGILDVDLLPFPGDSRSSDGNDY